MKKTSHKTNKEHRAFFPCQEIISIPVFLQPVLHNVALGLNFNLLLTKSGYSNCRTSCAWWQYVRLNMSHHLVSTSQQAKNGSKKQVATCCSSRSAVAAGFKLEPGVQTHSAAVHWLLHSLSPCCTTSWQPVSAEVHCANVNMVCLSNWVWLMCRAVFSNPGRLSVNWQIRRLPSCCFWNWLQLCTFSGCYVPSSCGWPVHLHTAG